MAEKIRVATIHLGPPLPAASCNQPGRRRGNTPGLEARAIPIRSCSRWGLPSHGHCWRMRWALTPPFHPYPPLQAVSGGMLSVALSLGNRSRSSASRPDVIRHRVSVEPGLSSRTLFRLCTSGCPAGWRERLTLLALWRSIESIREIKTRCCRNRGLDA